LGKAIGIFACTTLVAVTIWSVSDGRHTKTASAGDESVGADQFLAANRPASSEGARGQSDRSASYKAVAAQLMEEARNLATRGNLEGARSLARRAGTFPVQWQSNEQTPEQLLRLLGPSTADAPTGAVAQASEAPQPVDVLPEGPSAEEMAHWTTLQKQRYVGALLASARQDIRNRRVDLARQKAMAAQRVEVAYGVFDDRPAHVLAEIARLEQSHGEMPQHLASAEPNSPYAATIRGQNPSASGAEKLPAVKQTSFQGNAAGAPSGQSARQEALRLMKEARADLEAGHIEEARIKALKADEFEVAWGVFEERPRHLLAEIDRKTGTQTFARNTEKPTSSAQSGAVAAAGGANASPAGQKNHAQAQDLLRQARRDMKEGNYASARARAQKAGELSNEFGLFEDRPDVVMADIDLLESAAHGKSAPATGVRQVSNTQAEGDVASADSPADHEKSQTLLRQAREDLRNGRVEEARSKVAAASQLKVNYGLFDDRPELVAQVIDRTAGPSASGNAPSNVKQAGGTSDWSGAPTSPGSLGADDRQAAAELLRLARLDLEAGNLAAARQKATEAGRLNVAYGVFEERPEHVLADISRIEAERSIAQLKGGPQPAGPAASPADDGSWADDILVESTPAAAAPAGAPALPAQGPEINSGFGEPSRLNVGQANELPMSPAEAAAMPRHTAARPVPVVEEEVSPFSVENPFAPQTTSPADVAVIHPSGVSAQELYHHGMKLLREGRREDAYAAFLQAYHSGQQLDPHQQQHLEDFLRELRPGRTREIRQVGTGSRNTGNLEVADATGGAPRQGQLEIVEQQMAVKYDKLRTETLNAIFRAERLRDSNPEQAVSILDQAIANVGKSELGKDAVAPMLNQLNRTKASVESHAKQHEPVIAQQKRNREIEGELEQARLHEIRIDQEMARLVEEFNKLLKQERYAEAEVLAKQARELDRENPVAETMFWKAQLARRVASNEDLKSRKENAFWNSLNEVEEAAVAHFGKPMQFGKDWDEISNRRKGKYPADNRTRTEQELQIEKSLNRTISLHFENTPLVEVIRHIRTVADANVVLDAAGLEEEGHTTTTPVSIAVDGITLKSALNLILEPLNLGYMIDNEVLKITSHTRQQGKSHSELQCADTLRSRAQHGRPAGVECSTDGRHSAVVRPAHVPGG